MPKMKVPRKSTAIDMTAMCDVAFLLLSFFIFTAKFKKSEEIEIVTPNSVATDSVSQTNKFNIYCNVSGSGKVLIGFENDSITKLVGDSLNQYKALNLTPDELTVIGKRTGLGFDLKDMKAYAASIGTPNQPKEPDGIPLMDSADNQLNDWIDISDRIFQNGLKKNADLERTIYIKADKNAPYEVVDRVMETFAKKGLDRFKLVTTPKDIPMGTAMYRKYKEGKL